MKVSGTGFNNTTKLLVIDDDQPLLAGLSAIFKREGYQVVTADNGWDGIERARNFLPHIIICDLMMPQPDGYAVLNALSERPETVDIPFIFLTARSNEMDKIRGFRQGADDYITKPFAGPELLARVEAMLRRKNITISVARQALEKEINTLRSEIRSLLERQAQDSARLVDGLVQMMAIRDKETESHARRVMVMAEKFGNLLNFNGETMTHLRWGAILHDIGKVGIPDEILMKPGKLTPAEREVMKAHPRLGYQIVAPLGFPAIVTDITQYHHERWDGSGYPDRLKGEEIPLPARMFAIVDVWDALTSDRPYGHAWTYQKAREHLAQQSGKHFDPNIVSVFLNECIPLTEFPPTRG